MNRLISRKTRGKTRPGRLALLDALLCTRERSMLCRADGQWQAALFVDLGFGETPWTTLELADAIRETGSTFGVLGVDIDAQRVARATRMERADVRFVEGGFDFPAPADRAIAAIRAMNVLRQYREVDVAAAIEVLGARLLEGGLLIDGTSNKEGTALAAHWMRRGPHGLVREALAFSTTFARGFAPVLFRDVLPRDLRRRVVEGEPIMSFFAAWTHAWECARRAGARTPPECFAATAHCLAEEVEGVVLDNALLGRGTLVWAPPSGVPGPRWVSACVGGP